MRLPVCICPRQCKPRLGRHHALVRTPNRDAVVTVEVTAATLYEAVALGLAAICGNEWVTGIARGLNVVRVSVADVRAEHEARLRDFTKWLDKTGGSPREVSDRCKVRKILGMPVPR